LRDFGKDKVQKLILVKRLFKKTGFEQGFKCLQRRNVLYTSVSQTVVRGPLGVREELTRGPREIIALL